MLLPRMTVTRSRSLLPRLKEAIALARLARHGICEPFVERTARLGGLRVTKAAHVVIAVPATEEQTPSSRSGANARPIARCSAGARERNRDT